MIKYNYNRGDIIGQNKNNGGIVGGAAENTNDINKVYIEDCFSIGENTSIYANQIAPNYAKVVDSYYIYNKRNISGYGIHYVSKLFKYIAGETDLVYFRLVDKKFNMWALYYGDIILVWQNETW